MGQIFINLICHGKQKKKGKQLMVALISPIQDTKAQTIEAPVSKSAAHRLLICAALADTPCTIVCEGSNADIEATVSCLQGLGAKINRQGNLFQVIPIPFGNVQRGGLLDCGESGSTARFLLPILAALGAEASLNGHGRLPSRPLSPLYEEMERHGAKMSENGKMPLWVGGKLLPGCYTLDGGVSSQFISGLLFALPLLDDRSEIIVTGKIESEPYIEMTLDALRTFGVDVRREKNHFYVPASRYHSPGHCEVEGDWSNAAFWLSLGAIARPIHCTRLRPDSLQGDKAILDCLERFGAKILREKDQFTVSPAPLFGVEIDGANIPDLVPILSVVASHAQGKTVIQNIRRLRMKESDRVQTVLELLHAFGVEATADENSMTIYGRSQAPKNPVVDSHNDHRIAMAAAIAGAVEKSESVGQTKILGAQAVQKSYPDFYQVLSEITTVECIS
jgi:3-phosphoshikimate 1-carboxyvinyltransferase